MARRAGWTNLSDSQRKRYQRAGISRADYDAGVNLQSARGQGIERRRTEERPETGLPAPSTVREWRARAIRNKITRDDWDTALDATGLEDFDRLKEAVRGKEKAHKLWQAQGSPNSHVRKTMRAQGDYDYYGYDAPDDWGDSWEHYH